MTFWNYQTFKKEYLLKMIFTQFKKSVWGPKYQRKHFAQTNFEARFLIFLSFVLPNQNEISFPNNWVNLLLNTPCWKTNDVLFFIIVTLAFKQTGSNMIPHVATTLKNCAHFWDRKIIWPLPSDIYFALCA